MNRRKPKPTPAKKAKKKPATKSRPTTVRRRVKKPASPTPAEPRARMPEIVPAPAVAAEPEALVASEPAPPEPFELDIPFSTPEAIFAERVTPPELDRPFPVSRRAIFFDVENTSRAQHIARVIEHLQIDRLGQRTEFVAVGNWRVIGHDTARLLARHGAHLVHSAPSVGVRDWSDLRIAVGAGAWLAGARPGDVIEIVSDDRAFDAVGDVASSLGITFHRLSYRGLAGAPAEDIARAPVEAAVSESRSSSGDGRGQRYRGRFRGRRDGRPAPTPRPAPAPVAAAPPPPPDPVEADVPEGEPHTAPHDEIVGVVRDLMRANPGRGVSIDAVANALKARGFSRPPGSPRLITRLRRLKELEINRAGIITLVGATPAAAAPSAPAPSIPAPSVPAASAPAPSVERAEPQPEVVTIAPVVAQVEVEDEGPEPGNEKKKPVEIEEDEGPEPGNERIDSRPQAADASADAQRRRRRGGRRWHGRGRPQTSAAP